MPRKPLVDWTGRKYSARITIVEGKGFALHAVCVCGTHYHRNRRTIRDVIHGKFGCRGCIEKRNYAGTIHGIYAIGARADDGRWPWVCMRCGKTRLRTPRQIHAALVQPPPQWCHGCSWPEYRRRKKEQWTT